jgi:dihydrofolate synthase/folylpolyglutamate synthase
LKSFDSSDDVFNWLNDFINVERGQRIKAFRLDRMEALTQLADHPEKCADLIHIAGSKGKGSVAVMISAILAANGKLTARYMSPHVSDIRERISLSGGFFSEDVYVKSGEELREIVDIYLPAAKNPLFDTENKEGEPPTYFELLTLYFFLCARRAECDVMVVETGMGGRLDATNIVNPLVSVITLIELEHTVFLGNTFAAIAGEKAGIIKNNKPLILAGQNEEAYEVFKNKAVEKNSPLFYFPDIAQISEVKVGTERTEFMLVFKNDWKILNPEHLRIKIPISGIVQAENAALAVCAVKAAFPQINLNNVNCGFKKLNLPARFEKIAESPPFIIDGAHTAQSFSLCVETFTSLYGEGGVLLFGCAADKDPSAMAAIAAPRFSKIIITRPGTFKTSDPAHVYNSFSSVSGNDKTLLIPDTACAIDHAVKFSRENNLPLLSAGSFYLAAEVLDFFRK